MLPGKSQEEKNYRSIKMGKENNSNSGNKSQISGNGNQRRQRGFRYTKFRSNNKSGNGNASNGNNKLPAKKEYKFYMCDSSARCSAESFSKIRDSFILKIRKTFDSLRDIVKTLRDKTKMVISKLNPADPTGATE